MRSLVTGGAGFIGSHVVDSLLERGDEVLVLDDLSSGRRGNLTAALPAGAVLVEGSILDTELLRRTVASFVPERTFHLAAQVDVRKSVADPGRDAHLNVVGTINVLAALAAASTPSSLVLASTGGAIYGEGEGRDQPMDEAQDARPEAPYGTAKLAAELYVDLYRRAFGIEAASLRFANVYGPRQDPHGEAGVVAIFCGRIRSGDPLIAYGDGRQTRDYVFVDDVVAAVLAADSAMAQGRVPVAPLNIGTGEETSVLDLIEVLGEVSGAEPAVEFAPARPGEVQRVAIDPARAGRELGWAPAADLRTGLALTFESTAATAG